MMFDVLIKGGEVIDLGAGYTGQLDVAIQGNRIAAIDYTIPPEAAAHVIDATDQYVTPGLIDLHTHVYHDVTYWGIRPDPIAARTGVTTWVDAGSAGAFTVQGFRRFVVGPARVRIYALLNIAGIGLVARTGEHINIDFCDVELCCRLTQLNRDLVCGVKVRIDKDTVGPHGLEPLRRARQAAERCGVPMMVHIAAGPPLLDEVLPFLRAGDILTHCCTGQTMRILDQRGAISEAVCRAQAAGVILDVGHGAGSFSFEIAEALLSAGYRPDVISSDIHQVSVHGPLFDLPTCLSKFLTLGMSLPEVIGAATFRPAQILGLQSELGTLRPGAYADIALFRLDHGQFHFYDTGMQPREGAHLLRNTLTIVNGHPLPIQPSEPAAPWIELLPEQRELIVRGHLPGLMGRSLE